MPRQPQSKALPYDAQSEIDRVLDKPRQDSRADTSTVSLLIESVLKRIKTGLGNDARSWELMQVSDGGVCVKPLQNSFESIGLINNLIDAIQEFQFDLDGTRRILRKLVSEVRRIYSISYSIKPDGTLWRHIKGTLVIGKDGIENQFLLPNEVQSILIGLDLAGAEVLAKKTRSDLDGLDLAERLAEVKRRIGNVHANREPLYTAVLERMRADVEKELSLEKEKKANIDAIKTSDATRTQDPDTQKAKIKRHPDLTIDRAILLIDAIGGSRLKSADREKLADVIAFLTGDAPESVRKRYSALNPENDKYKGSSERGVKALTHDMEILTHYFNLIGLRGELEKISDNLGIPLTR
ncbi:MAG: hypothetical protein ABIU09_13475 [Pyrinomonadaceae bacterium]